MTTDQPHPVIASADLTYEAMRAINHATITAALPAPVVYEVLGNLKNSGGHMLAQTCTQLAKTLGRPLEAYDVVEDDGGDPVQSVATATDHLLRAAELAGQIGTELEAAQSAISRQAYR